MQLSMFLILGIPGRQGIRFSQVVLGGLSMIGESEYPGR